MQVLIQQVRVGPESRHCEDSPAVPLALRPPLGERGGPGRLWPGSSCVSCLVSSSLVTWDCVHGTFLPILQSQAHKHVLGGPPTELTAPHLHSQTPSS